MPKAAHRNSGTTRRARKRDANEPDIIKAAESVGATVVQLDKPVDLLVGFRGVTHVWEVKNPDGKDRINKDQQAFIDEWNGRPVQVIRTTDEALEALGVHKRGIAAFRQPRSW